METKRNLLAVFLISIIILLTPTWLSLFSPEKFDSEIMQKSTEKTYIEKNTQTQKKPANPVLFNSDQKSIYIETNLFKATISNQSGGSFTSFVF